MKAEQNLFTKLLVVSQTRKINLQAILKYELSAVPLSLFFSRWHSAMALGACLCKDCTNDDTEELSVDSDDDDDE